MAGWRGRWYTLTSFLICAMVVAVGTLLYPLFLLLFSGIALIASIRRRPGPAAPVPGEGARRGMTGR